MAKRQKLSPGREMALNILFGNYDIQSADDLQDTLKDLLGDGIRKMLEAEMEEPPGYEKGIRKLAAYVILGIYKDGKKEILRLYVKQ